MRTISIVQLAVLSGLSLAAPSIILIGDSTVTDAKGWGPGFCADTTGLASCTNLAVSGKTCITWQEQTQYTTMLTKCKTADTWATIQFAHNDQKVVNTTVFNANLEALTKKVQAAGCKPILMTPLARRTFSSEHVTSDTLGPYAAETIKVATKLGLPLLPLLADSLAYIGKLGKTLSADFNYESGDNTHLNAKGAQYFGRIVADEVIAKVSYLAPYITKDAALSAKIAAGTE